MQADIVRLHTYVLYVDLSGFILGLQDKASVLQVIGPLDSYM